MNDALTVHELSFFYEREKAIFNNLSFSVKEKSFLPIIGVNGAGKTTLVKLILGLLKPQKGTIKIFNKSLEESKNSLGYVPQQIIYDPQFPISVREVIAFGLINFKCSKHKEEDCIDYALEQVNLLHLKNKPFTTLSGGEKQRTLIARAIINHPSILILDEPTASLDPKNKSRIIELCRKLNENYTIIFITHDLTILAEMKEDIYCLTNGKMNLYHHSQLTNTEEVFHILEGNSL